MTIQHHSAPRGLLLRQARRTLGWGVGLALFLTVFVDAAILTVPIYDMQLFDRVMLSRNMNTVAMLSIAAAAGLIIYGALDYLRSATLVAIAEQVHGILSGPVLEAGVRHSMSGKQSTGAEAVRDLNEIRNFLSSGAVSTPLDALCAPLLLAVLFMLHPAFGWLGMAGVSALVILGIITDVLVRPAVIAAGQQRTQAAHRLAGELRESDLTEGLGMAPAIARRWALNQAKALHMMRRAAGHSDDVGAIAKIVRLALQAGVMAMGAVLILSTQASPGALMGANLLLGKVLGPFDALVSTWRRWISAGAAWRRVTTLLAECDRAVAPASVERADEQGLVLQGVGLVTQPTARTLLDDINITFAPGTATALVGPNGAGKSTLLRIMMGLEHPTTGHIRLDGVSLAHVDRSRIGYLSQGVHLLDGTVWDNVGRFQNAAPEDVIAATSMAGVHDVIGRLRQGYGARIGPAALSLSGGQRQRIGLARALYRTPALIGLDEPDASLDNAGEEALLQAIAAGRKAGAIIVVATHRPKLLAAMDRVVTVQEGRIHSVTSTERTNQPTGALVEPARA